MDWTQIVIVVINVVIAPIIAWGIATLRKYLIEKSENEYVDNFINKVADIIQDTVGAANQTIVDDIKGTDEWTDEAKNRIFKDVLDVVKTKLGTEGLDLLDEIRGDADEYLENKILAWVNKLKK